MSEQPSTAAQRELTETPAGRYRWVVFGLWSFSTTSNFMVATVFGILLPSITSELRLSPSQQGLLTSSVFWGALALGIPMSWWGSRFRPKILTSVTLLLASLLLFLQGWAPFFGVLLVARLGFGLNRLAAEAARAPVIRQWFLEREVVLVNSISNGFYGIVFGVGWLATPFVLSGLDDDWRMTFYAFAIFLGALTLLWMVLGRNRETEEYRRQSVPREAGILRSALAYRDLWVGAFGFLGTTVASGAFYGFFPTLMLDAYGVSLKWSGGILALGVVAGGVAGFGAAYVDRSLGQRKALFQYLGLLLTGSFVGMTLTGSVPLLILISFLNGVAWGFWPVLYSVPFQLPGIRTREVAVALAATTLMISGGMMLGPLITGFLQESLGDLKQALLIVSFASLSLTVAGTVLRPVDHSHGMRSADLPQKV